MDSKAASSRNYQDFEPTTSMIHEEDCDTILFCLPGFRKNHLRVQLLPTRTLKVSGERQAGDNKWIRFQKEYQVSTNCDTSKITAKFEIKEKDIGMLYIRQPMFITPAVKKDEEKLENEAQKHEKNETKSHEMNNDVKQRNEIKNGENLETEDKITSEYDDAEDGDLAKKEVHENGKGKRVDKIKMAKKFGTMMSVFVVVISAIALGIYVKNLIMPAKNYEVSLFCKI